MRKEIIAYIKKNYTKLVIGTSFILLLLIIYAMPRVVLEVASANVKKELPIYCVDRKDKVVALTFDAAWGNSDTKQIMDILDKYDIKVTFFATGGWVESYPEDVKMIISKGHAFGNHSEHHKFMTKLNRDQKIEEIQSVHEKVKELTGYEMCVFRPPYGDYNDDVIKCIEDQGYYAIQWSVDSLDWKDYGVDAIIRTVCNHKNLESGAIILMHNGAKYTAEALEDVIINLTDQGYSFVTVPELIYSEDYHMDHTGKQIQNK